jgi:hypothetical protein
VRNIYGPFDNSNEDNEVNTSTERHLIHFGFNSPYFHDTLSIFIVKDITDNDSLSSTSIQGKAYIGFNCLMLSRSSSDSYTLPHEVGHAS